MNRRSVALLALTTVAALSGCVAPQTKAGVEGIYEATASQCRENLRTMELAVESYTLLEGAVPVEALMVPDYMTIESPYFDIDAQGKVVPAPGGGCE